MNTITPEERFTSLFHGNEAEAWGSYYLTGGLRVDGKRKKKCLTHEPGAVAKTGNFDREISPQDWQEHFTGGTNRLGVCPIIDRADNLLIWGALDIDSDAKPKADIEQIARTIEKEGYPLVVTVSPSANSAHLYLFANEPVPAWEMVARLEEYREKLFLDPETEIYPMATELPEKLLDEKGRLNCGKWLAHPYYGDTTYAITPAGPVAGSKTLTTGVMDYLESKRMDAAWFHREEESTTAKGKDKESRSKDKKKFVMPDKVGRTEFHDTFLSLAGQLREKGFDLEAMKTEMYAVAESANDTGMPVGKEALDKIAEYICDKYPAGGKKEKFFYDPPDTGDLWAHNWKKEEDVWKDTPVHVSSRIVALGEINDAKRGAAGLQVEITGRTGIRTRHLIPRAMAETPAELFPLLARLDVVLESNPAARGLLQEFLRTSAHDNQVLQVDQVGWHRDVFVMPDRQYAGLPKPDGTKLYGSWKLPAENIVLAGAPNDHPFKMAGDFTDWQQYVSDLCPGNSRLLLAVSAAFVGPLLRFHSGASNFGFNIWGRGSTGKTTTLSVAGSVWGGKDRKTGYSESWRTTDNALEGTAKLHNDGLLCLDEIKQLDPHKIVDVVQMLGNGNSKGRSTRTGESRETATWSLVTLSTGETPIKDVVARSGAKGVGEAGQAVRLIDVPAEYEAGKGVFENLHGLADGASFADHLVRLTRANYGWAIHEFLETDLTESAERYRVLVGEILKRFKVKLSSTDGEGLRVAQAFAITAAAGELACELGVLGVGWKPGDAEWGAKTCFADWLTNRGAGSSDDNSAVEFITATIQKYGDSRFQHIHSDGEAAASSYINDKLGFWWSWPGIDNRKIFFILPEAFKEYCVQTGHQAVNWKAIEDHGMLMEKDGGRGFQYSKKIAGVRTRGYLVRLAEAEELASAS